MALRPGSWRRQLLEGGPAPLQRSAKQWRVPRRAAEGGGERVPPERMAKGPAGPMEAKEGRERPRGGYIARAAFKIGGGVAP